MSDRKIPFEESCEGFFDHVSVHGLREVYHARSRTSRLFWILSLTTASFMAVWGCWSIIEFYLTSPIIVSYTVQPATERFVPDVMVCPFSRFKKSFLDKYNISNEIAEYVQIVFGHLPLYPFSAKFRNISYAGNSTDWRRERELRALLTRLGNISIDDLMDIGGYSCRELVPYCATVHGIEDCCVRAEPVILQVGKCYQIGSQFPQMSSGFGFGQTFVINVPEPDGQGPGINNLHNEGVSIKLVEADKGPNFDLTFIPPGVHALLPLRSTLYEFIKYPPKFDCYIPPEDRKLAEREMYSPLRCFDDCFFKRATIECGCKQITLTHGMYKNFPSCTPKHLSGCLVRSLKKQFENDKQMLTECREKCKLPCTYWEFLPTMSYAKFPSSTFFEYLGLHNDHNINWNRSIILEVFYEKLEYTLIKHHKSIEPMTVVSNFGGQLGLWLGGSVLSVAQILASVAVCISSAVNRQQRQLRRSSWSKIEPSMKNINSCYKSSTYV